MAQKNPNKDMFCISIIMLEIKKDLTFLFEVSSPFGSKDQEAQHQQKSDQTYHNITSSFHYLQRKQKVHVSVICEW